MPTKPILNTVQRELVMNQLVARLATSTSIGEPYLIPVTFVLDANRILIVIDDKPKSGGPLRRVRNILENSSVAVLFDHYEDDWNQLWWLLIRGNGEILQFDDFSEDQQSNIPALFKKKYHQYSDLIFYEKTFISISIKTVSSWRFDGS